MALNVYIDKAVELTITYLPKFILALLTLFIGFRIIKWVVSLSGKALKKKKLEPTLIHFLGSFISIILKVMLLISVAGMIGIETTSFVAVLAAMGLAVGLALQGSLANFAGGVLIALFKPFLIDDVINAQGFLGKVEKIEIFNTILKTPDNQTVIIPNGVLSNGPITNVTREPTRRVDMVFGIGYGDDIKLASDTLLDIVKNHKKVLKNPEPQVVVAELADSSVNFKVRPWCKTEDYWAVFFDITEEVKLRFDREGISIPYPQTDVHLHK